MIADSNINPIWFFSVSSLLTTTEAVIVEHPEQESRVPSRVPDMDQMDL